MKDGRHVKVHLAGENNPIHKLFNQDVLKIRELYFIGNYYKNELGKMFGVSGVQINNIINKIQWCRI